MLQRARLSSEVDGSSSATSCAPSLAGRRFGLARSPEANRTAIERADSVLDMRFWRFERVVTGNAPVTDRAVEVDVLPLHLP